MGTTSRQLKKNKFLMKNIEQRQPFKVFNIKHQSILKQHLNIINTIRKYTARVKILSKLGHQHKKHL